MKRIVIMDGIRESKDTIRLTSVRLLSYDGTTIPSRTVESHESDHYECADFEEDSQTKGKDSLPDKPV